MTFAELLTRYREREDKTITEMARSIDSNRSYLSRLENGHEKRPSKDLILRIADFLSLSEEERAKLLNTVGKGLTPQTASLISQRKEVVGNMETNNKKINIDIPSNVSVLFSDAAIISSSANGLTITFAQNIHENNFKAVSRIGVSIEHAEKLIDALEKEIANARKFIKGERRETN
jgi:transcriptional regulator with XRE-family HTH domain